LTLRCVALEKSPIVTRDPTAHKYRLTLLAAGATTVAIVLGGLLVAACATVTATNLCLPSLALAW